MKRNDETEFARGRAVMAIASRACKELRSAKAKGKVGMAEAAQVAAKPIGAALILAIALAASTNDPKRLRELERFAPKGKGPDESDAADL